MSDAILVALIISIGAFFGPLTVSKFNAKERRRERAEDRASLEQVAEKVAENSDVIGGKLDTIHTLVNSSMTAAMQDTLDTTIRVLALLREKPEPSVEVLLAIEETKAKIGELQAQLADRATQQAIVVAEEGKTS